MRVKNDRAHPNSDGNALDCERAVVLDVYQEHHAAVPPGF